MLVCACDVAQGSSQEFDVGEPLLGAKQHLVRGVDAARGPVQGICAAPRKDATLSSGIASFLSRRLGTQATREQHHPANKDIRLGGNLRKRLHQFLLSPLPEGIAVVEVKRHQGAVLLCCANKSEAA